jgi:hypothetical protein
MELYTRYEGTCGKVELKLIDLPPIYLLHHMYYLRPLVVRMCPCRSGYCTLLMFS